MEEGGLYNTLFPDSATPGVNNFLTMFLLIAGVMLILAVGSTVLLLLGWLPAFIMGYVIWSTVLVIFAFFLGALLNVRREVLGVLIYQYTIEHPDGASTGLLDRILWFRFTNIRSIFSKLIPAITKKIFMGDLALLVIWIVLLILFQIIQALR
jgi:hypothetical protein